MAERKNLPAAIAGQAIGVPTEQRGSLVARGLAALRKSNGERYRQGAEQGDDESQLKLGLMYESGQGVEQNDEQALYWYRKAAEQENAAAQWLLAGMYEYGRGVIPNIEEAVSWYRQSAKNGDERALKDLDGINGIGRGAALDEEQSVYWNQKSAEEGHIWAMMNLGTMYKNGLRVNQDDEQALFWYRKAAEQGYPWSDVDFGADRFFQLGMRYRYGEDGTEVNDEKAREYFGEAAELDHVEAQLELARLLFELGEHDEAQEWLDALVCQEYGPAIHCLVVEHDGLYGRDEDAQEELLLQASRWYESCVLAGGDAKRQFEFSEILFLCCIEHDGLRWLKASAEQDYSEACYRLGHWYLRGKVSEYSTQQGIYWLSRAAELGWLSAYENLGDLYLLGHGPAPNQWTAPTPRIAPDMVAAVAWYERAIAKGMRRVAYKLGNHYLTGAHLDQDLFLAEKWLLHAAHEGSASAQQTLGEEYASGVRLRQDAGAAIEWLKLAADNHQVSAGLKLAEIFLDGKITPGNFDEATEWLSRVAVHGTLRNDAMKMMAEKCFDGRFSAEDESYAQAWLDRVAKDTRKLAADTEHPRAAHHAYEFAELYELGLGVEQDMGKAIHWYKQSAAQGLQAAQKRLKELGIEWKTP